MPLYPLASPDRPSYFCANIRRYFSSNSCFFGRYYIVLNVIFSFSVEIILCFNVTSYWDEIPILWCTFFKHIFFPKGKSTFFDNFNGDPPLPLLCHQNMANFSFWSTLRGNPEPIIIIRYHTTPSQQKIALLLFAKKIYHNKKTSKNTTKYS